MIMTLLKIIDSILNKKNQINSLNNSCNNNYSSQNYRRYLKQKESDLTFMITILKILLLNPELRNYFNLSNTKIPC